VPPPCPSSIALMRLRSADSRLRGRWACWHSARLLAGMRRGTASLGTSQARPHCQ
jgi:hypothetical protein